MSTKPKFEVTVYPATSSDYAKSSLLYGFTNFEEIAKLYPGRDFSLLNIDTGEYRRYAPDGKPIGVFF